MPLFCATSFTSHTPMVDNVNGIPTAFAALAALTSPRLEYIPAIPTGPRTTGSDIA